MSAKEIRDRLEKAFGKNPPGDDLVSESLRRFLNDPALLGKKKKATPPTAKSPRSRTRKKVK